jgi:hypothetical protein
MEKKEERREDKIKEGRDTGTHPVVSSNIRANQSVDIAIEDICFTENCLV